jgi:hypothetical protein
MRVKLNKTEAHSINSEIEPSHAYFIHITKELQMSILAGLHFCFCLRFTAGNTRVEIITEVHFQFFLIIASIELTFIYICGTSSASASASITSENKVNHNRRYTHVCF